MLPRRNSQQVAKRAMILSAMAFRASLEVTEHPRVAGIAQRLLPWLTEVGCGDEVSPIEREELATPLGGLSESQMGDVRWAGEEAAFLCWMLGMGGELDERERADPTILPTFRSILRPEAVGIIGAAVLREGREIEAACRQCVLIRSLLQESRVDEAVAREVIRGVHVRKLDEVGLAVREEDVRRAAEVVGRMTLEDRYGVAGLYFVRHHAAMWFLREGGGYWS